VHVTIIRSDEAECDGLGTRNARGRAQKSLTEIATSSEQGTSTSIQRKSDSRWMEKRGYSPNM
jgi:hypothetical protein